MFARNEFESVNSDLDLENKLDRSCGVREAVRLMFVGGGQGMLKCNCHGDFKSNRCSCKKNKLLCNSRCHGGSCNCTINNYSHFFLFL